MLNKLQKNKKYIELKDGNNYGLIYGVILVLMVCSLLFTSKLWLPDTRINMTTKIGDVLFFTLNEVEVKKYNIDYSTNIGEILISQKKSSEKSKYDLSYKVYDDKGHELPFAIIKGNNKKENEDSVMMYQDTLIQFSVYKEIYYVEIKVTQKDSTSQSIYVDYRNFNKKQVLEKGKKYLVNLDVEKSHLYSMTKQLKLYLDKKKLLDEEIKLIQNLKGTEKQDKQSRMIEVKSELELLQEEMKPLIKDIENQQNKIKELE